MQVRERVGLLSLCMSPHPQKKSVLWGQFSAETQAMKDDQGLQAVLCGPFRRLQPKEATPGIGHRGSCQGFQAACSALLLPAFLSQGPLNPAGAFRTHSRLGTKTPNLEPTLPGKMSLAGAA